MLTLSHITGIGKPYSLSCCTDSESESMLSVNIPMGFKRISDKHCSESVFEGVITEINEKNAILNTRIPIGVFENISLCAENEVFCKVLRAENQSFLLRFTAGHTEFCARAMETSAGV